jgi:hypothetical protein
MAYLNNKNNKHFIAATKTVSIMAIAIILVAARIVTSAAAQQTTITTTAAGGDNTTTAFSSSSSSVIKLSSQRIYEESSPPGNITPINETHGIFTFNGTGMITLPNSTQAINTTHNGTAFISFTTSSGYGRETIKAADGKTVTATVYEIVESNPTTPNVGKGIVTAVFQTNSTGTLASLNGMILVGTDDMSTGGASHVTLWRWESGIVSSSNTSASSTTITSNNSTSIAVPP